MDFHSRAAIKNGHLQSSALAGYRIIVDIESMQIQPYQCKWGKAVKIPPTPQSLLDLKCMECMVLQTCAFKLDHVPTYIALHGKIGWFSVSLKVIAL